jgi:5-methyltetrahydrofolate--homocysteine methyltransferase
VDPYRSAKEEAVADLQQLAVAVETGDRSTAVRVATEAVAEGLDPQSVLASMTAAMRTVGQRFQRNEIYIPEMLIAARAMQAATAVLEPALVASGSRPEHKAVLGTVAGDLHDIGKNLVGMMWRGANFDVVDLGVDVSPDRFAQAVREHQASLVGLSALLTTTMVGMRDAVEAIRALNGTNVKIIVGGAPVSAEFAREIGADGYAEDAGGAVEAALAVLQS